MDSVARDIFLTSMKRLILFTSLVISGFWCQCAKPSKNIFSAGVAVKFDRPKAIAMSLDDWMFNQVYYRLCGDNHWHRWRTGRLCITSMDIGSCSNSLFYLLGERERSVLHSSILQFENILFAWGIVFSFADMTFWDEKKHAVMIRQCLESPLLLQPLIANQL